MVEVPLWIVYAVVANVTLAATKTILFSLAWRRRQNQ